MKTCIAIITSLACVACSPGIFIQPPGSATEGETTDIDVTIDTNGVTISEKTLVLEHQYPDTGFSWETPLQDATTYTTPELSYGNYQAKVVVKHNGKVYPPGYVTTSERAEFTVQPDFPEGCFLFNEPEDIEGWSIEPIGESCTAALAHSPSSFPFAIIADTAGIEVGSLAALTAITPQCANDPQGWKYFVNSPPINDRNWENIQAIRFRLASVTQLVEPIQARLTARLADGSSHFERDSQGEFIMHSLTGRDWHTFDLDLSNASSQNVTRLNFIFGGPQTTPYITNELQPVIDAICPIK